MPPHYQHHPYLPRMKAARATKDYGFEFAAAIGSLIWLMKTFVKLSLAIWKLAKYMQSPAKRHFIYLRHLQNHIQCHRFSGG
jgi:hypothetical protein